MSTQEGRASVEEAFRHYRERYDVFHKFDRPLPSAFGALYRTLVHVLATGLDQIVAAVLRPLIKGLCASGPGTLALVFSTNQSRIARKLLELDIPLAPVSLGGFEPAFETERAQIGNGILLLASLADASRTARALSAASDDPVMANNSARVAKSCGLVFVLEHLFEKTDRVVLFNDHSPYSVLSHDIAEDRGLTTVYVQHAPVNDEFPPLYNDLNVLFSQAAADMYDARPGAEVFVLFDIRMLDCTSCDLDPADGRPVLVCTNANDEFDRIIELVDRLLDDGYEVILRPHPRESRPWHRLPVSIEVSRTGTIWEDMQRSGPVLANESAVALDAIFMGRLFFKCAFLSRRLDNYRFLREGLLTGEYESIDRLLADIRAGKRAYDPGKLDYFVGSMSEWRKRTDRLRELLL